MKHPIFIFLVTQFASLYKYLCTRMLICEDPFHFERFYLTRFPSYKTNIFHAVQRMYTSLFNICFFFVFPLRSFLKFRCICELKRIFFSEVYFLTQIISLVLSYLHSLWTFKKLISSKFPKTNCLVILRISHRFADIIRQIGLGIFLSKGTHKGS